MKAIQSANYRGTLKQPGAIAMFRRARLLADDRPEPVIGLIVSFTATKDYYQAATLLGPLARHWPGLLANQDLLGAYGSQVQMRADLVDIKQAASARPDADLDLLSAFFGWFFENRQQVSSQVTRLETTAGPDSTAAALAEAMRHALTHGGG